MNLSTAVVSIILLAIVILAIRYLVKTQKRDKGCLGGCSGCEKKHQCDAIKKSLSEYKG